MPYKKRQYKRKSRPRRRAKKNGIVALSTRVISDSTIVKLRYVDTVTLDAGVGAKAYDTWYANSLFDPYVGVGGHQPLGFDEWSAFYEHYIVLGAKCTATFHNHDNAGASDSQLCVARCDTDASWAPTDINTLIEEGKTAHKYLTPAGGSRDCVKVCAYFSPKKLLGIPQPKSSINLRGATGDTGSNPEQKCYFHVGVGSATPATNPGAVTCLVVVDYIAMFTGRKALGAS